MNFVETYTQFIKHLKGKIPDIQLKGLQEKPRINPKIDPNPRDWFIDSFEWYVGVKLLRGRKYGPFYRIDGDYFWPTIGNLVDEYSESKCFFGLEKPTTYQDAERLYKLQLSTLTSFVYDINVEMPEWPIIDDAYLFIGAVKGGEGFQVNPNGRVVQMLRTDIENNKLKRYSSSKSIYDYSKSEQYTFIKAEK
ncbi:MAG: hypothetical protein SRB2_03870 [Desulfobacteraceae bacterium Eth-SRB2]|nr:MAG: hypothetical protein SRB2_03870 [Desulfobacteraceae bacterium Eth-SRB2]